MIPQLRLRLLALAAAGALAACGGSSKKGCNPVAGTGCSSGLVCENVQGGSPACFDPLVLRGAIFELGKDATTGPIAGARVVALDPNDAPLGGVAISAADGSYETAVPATRAPDGSPSGDKVTLRADARGYQSFPGGLRVAVPITLSSTAATHSGGRWIVQGTLTDVALAKLADATLTASLHGHVDVPPSRAGVLVVAEHTVQQTDPSGAQVPVTVGVTGIADLAGAYAIYNLAPDTWTVRAFARGSNYEHKDQPLADGQDAQVDLARTGLATAQVTGGLNRVSGASGATSVILALRSTFDDPFGTGLPLGRAVAVPGLRLPLPDGTSDFTFSGVSDGEYVVLAAFENDGLVRQVSGQGGTQPAFVSVAGPGTFSLPSQPKIVPAVQLVGPGADPLATTPPVVTGSVTISWDEYSSAGLYSIEVFDAFGTKIWSIPDPILVPQSGSTTLVFNQAGAFDPKAQGACQSNQCSVAYAGPALSSGLVYQVRVTAWGTISSVLVPFSRTEDLLGIFTWMP